MSDLPIVAWAEYARESLIGVSMQHDEESPFLQRALTDHAAATASLESAQQRIEELERALGAEVAPRQLYEAIDADFAENPTRHAWGRLSNYKKRVWRGYANVVSAWAHACASDRNPQDGDANAAPATRPSKGFLKGESPQATWPFAQDDESSSKSSEP